MESASIHNVGLTENIVKLLLIALCDMTVDFLAWKIEQCIDILNLKCSSPCAKGTAAVAKDENWSQPDKDGEVETRKFVSRKYVTA